MTTILRSSWFALAWPRTLGSEQQINNAILISPLLKLEREPCGTRFRTSTSVLTSCGGISTRRSAGRISWAARSVRSRTRHTPSRTRMPCRQSSASSATSCTDPQVRTVFTDPRQRCRGFFVEPRVTLQNWRRPSVVGDPLVSLRGARSCGRPACRLSPLPRHLRHEPRVNLIVRHVGWNLGSLPSAARRGVLRADPDLFAQFDLAEVHILVGQNHDHPLVDVHDDLLPRFDGNARPLLELAVIGLLPPGVRVARLDANTQPASGALEIHDHLACQRIPLRSQPGVQYPGAEPVTAHGRPRLVDGAPATAGRAVPAPHARGLVEFVDLRQLAAQRAVAANASAGVVWRLGVIAHGDSGSST